MCLCSCCLHHIISFYNHLLLHTAINKLLLTNEPFINISTYLIGLATLAGREFYKNQLTDSENDQTSYNSGRRQVILGT